MLGEIDQHGQIITIERHILEEQNFFPEATGTLTNLLYDIALAGKIIASKTNRAGLAEILGRTGDTNIQGEQVQKLDRFADATFFRMNDHTGRVALMASEEHADILPIPEKYPAGKYVLLYDPLDGSSNIDYNICLGTIFSIYRKITVGRGSLEDCLQKGRQVVAAGYLLYGTSTMLVYSTGRGVNGFTLDPAVGEFLLSHPTSTSRNSRAITVSTRAMKNIGARECGNIPPGYRGGNPVIRACRLVMLAPWWRISTAICSQAECFIILLIPRIPKNRMGSSAFFMKPSRWLSWPNRPGAVPQMGLAISSTFHRKRSTSAPLSSPVTGTLWSRPSHLSGSTVDGQGGLLFWPLPRVLSMGQRRMIYFSPLKYLYPPVDRYALSLSTSLCPSLVMNVY